MRRSGEGCEKEPAQAMAIVGRQQRAAEQKHRGLAAWASCEAWLSWIHVLCHGPCLLLLKGVHICETLCVVVVVVVAAAAAAAAAVVVRLGGRMMEKHPGLEA